MKIIFTGLFLICIGCASNLPIPRLTQPIEREKALNVSYDQLWDAVTNAIKTYETAVITVSGPSGPAFTKVSKISVITMDKQSGIIVCSLPLDGFMTYKYFYYGPMLLAIKPKLLEDMQVYLSIYIKTIDPQKVKIYLYPKIIFLSEFNSTFSNGLIEKEFFQKLETAMKK